MTTYDETGPPMYLRWHERDDGRAQLYVMDSETFRKYPLEVAGDLASIGAFIIGLNEVTRDEVVNSSPVVEALRKEVHELIRIARKTLRSIELLEMVVAKEDLWANMEKYEDLQVVIDEYEDLCAIIDECEDLREIIDEYDTLDD